MKEQTKQEQGRIDIFQEGYDKGKLAGALIEQNRIIEVISYQNVLVRKDGSLWISLNDLIKEIKSSTKSKGNLLLNSSESSGDKSPNKSVKDSNAMFRTQQAQTGSDIKIKQGEHTK